MHGAQAIHHFGVTHGDLRLANWVVNSHRQLVIIDFADAKDHFCRLPYEILVPMKLEYSHPRVCCEELIDLGDTMRSWEGSSILKYLRPLYQLASGRVWYKGKMTYKSHVPPEDAWTVPALHDDPWTYGPQPVIGVFLLNSMCTSI